MRIPQQVLSHSLLSFLNSEKLIQILDSAIEFEIKENKFFEQQFSSDRLFLCTDGLVSIIDKKLERQTSKVIPGRSIELQSLFLERETSQFKWLAKTDSKFLSIDFNLFKNLVEKDTLSYLYRISTKVELQNIKNSLRLFHIPEVHIRNLIKSFEEVDFNQTTDDVGCCIPIDKEVKVLFEMPDHPKKEIFSCQPGNLFIKHQIEGLEYSNDSNRCWFITKEETDKISPEIFNSVEILDVIKDKIQEYKESNQEKVSEDETEAEPDLDDGISMDSFHKETVKKEIGTFKKRVAIQQHDMMDCGAAC